MHGESPTRDAKLAVLAAKQHGVVAYRQLIAIGFMRGAIQHRLLTKRLHGMYKGVYSVGYPAETAEAWEMAAVLACGRGAVVSHWTAVSRWELLRPTRGYVHVSVPSDRRVKGIRIHHVKLHRSDYTKRNGIPITTVPRTLLDLAAVAPLSQLRRATNEAARRGKLNRQAIRDLLDRNPRRTGTKALTAVIAAVDPQTRRSRSDLETAFLALCRKYSIPTPVVNTTVAGLEVDMHWPGTRLIVELDSYRYHRAPAEFDDDRRRDARLKVAGYEVLRISDQWLNTDPRGVAETVYSLVTSGSIASSE
jgi:very-short-patch-repair endonuclease